MTALYRRAGLHAGMPSRVLAAFGPCSVPARLAEHATTSGNAILRKRRAQRPFQLAVARPRNALELAGESAQEIIARAGIQQRGRLHHLPELFFVERHRPTSANLSRLI